MNMCGSVEVDANLKKDEGQSIVCSADGFTMWSDFPKGLKVLLLDHDGISAAEIKSKLEGMDYLVSLFYNEDEALEAVSNKMESFHVAIVEVNTSNSHESFRFLQMARDLPTIMISNVHCLNTMMKCIALGAAEFLQKPLSEDKLRNIWQHVVHKAFNAGENALSKSLKPIKETVVSMLHMQSDTGTSLTENQKQTEATNVQELTEEKAHDDPEANDRFPEPSTPQLEQGVRQEDSGDGQDRTNSSMEQEEREHVKENVEQMLSCSESKSVDNTCNNNSTVEVVPMEEVPSSSGEAAAEEEVNSASGTKTDEDSDPKECIIPSSESKDGVKVESSAGDPIKKNASIHRSSCSNSSKASKKKMTVSKVDWTSELHRRFVQAVEQLGIDQAIPSKILELMKVEGLTRHNVASHLQKYRLHKRHVLPKDEERRWPPYRDPMSRVYAHKPIVAFPHVWSNYGFPPNHAYPVWGHPSSIPMWGYNSYQTWRPSHGSWPWKSYTRMYADAWGCPESPFSSHTYQNWPPNHSFDGLEYHKQEPRNLYDCHLGEEVVDKVVKEAINKPWLPLPLGLKPPSIDTVLAELHRQGIRSIPPPS